MLRSGELRCVAMCLGAMPHGAVKCITSQHGAIIDSASLLVVHHHRMPQWLRKFEFDAQVANSFGVQMEKVDLAVMPLREQILLVSQSRGMISQQGASLVNLVYLTALAPVLIIDIATDLLIGSHERQGSCGAQPLTCHDRLGEYLHEGGKLWKWRFDEEGGRLLHHTDKGMEVYRRVEGRSTRGAA